MVAWRQLVPDLVVPASQRPCGQLVILGCQMATAPVIEPVQKRSPFVEVMRIHLIAHLVAELVV